MISDSDRIDVILIYPQLGTFDNIVRDIPLSLIYAAADTVKKGYKVKIIDLRVDASAWKRSLDSYIKAGASLIGLSVMTGHPILTSLEISKYIKSRYKTPIVWGGAHPTILPEQTLENENIDYVIRDWGSRSLLELLEHLQGKSSDIKSIQGLGYKANGKSILNPSRCSFEMPHYLDLPYHLVDINAQNYNRLVNGEVILPIFTAMGCPYQCSFCMAPTIYRKVVGKKWIAYDNNEVLDHIAHLAARYEFQRLQIYDDDSFIDLDRLHDLLSGYVKRGYSKKYKLDFRGARVNELDRMDDDFVRLLVEANVELLAIGAESGSEKSLVSMNKGISVDQTIRVNQKLARHPSLKPHFNFFCGIPGETLDDLLETKKLILQLAEDNPNCYLGVGADWKPLPGTVMTDLAVQNYGLRLPANLVEWAAIDSFNAKKIVHPWYTDEINNYIKLLQIAGLLMDKKIEMLEKEMGSKSNILFILFLLAKMYRPILKFRLKHNLSGFLIEYPLRSAAIRVINMFKSN